MVQNAPGYRTAPDAGEIWESNPGPLTVAEHSLSKREVAGPIPAEGLVWNIARDLALVLCH